MDPAQLLKGLRDALFHEDVVPPGWYTLTQLRDGWGLSYSHTQRLVQRGVEAGVIAHQKFKVRTNKRGIYPTWHYNLNQDACPTSQKTNSATKRSKKSSKKRRN